MIRGRIHSFETCGSVDGPGLRFVLFVQGCPIFCLYCHNPDSRSSKGGSIISVDEVLEEIKKYRSYIQKSGGGVTISGGEPLLQPLFVREILKRCKELGLHTALDTAGSLRLCKPFENLLKNTDLVLLDIKSIHPKTYKKITGADLKSTLEWAEYLEKINKPTWLRFVLVPGLSDNEEEIHALAKYAASKKNIERIDVLPFHKMGESKWERLGYEYTLKNTPSPSKEELEKSKNIFKRYHKNVF